jgi:UDP-glucose 4-epimerase
MKMHRARDGNLTRMKVAITGASGYIGEWLMAELSSHGHDVHAQDLMRPDGAVNWTAFRVFDLTDDDERATWLRDTDPELVIHLAALYGRVWGEADLVKTARVNAGLTAALARDAASFNARLMYVSSSEVYGQSADGETVYADSGLSPLNMYGLTKKWGEEAAQLYAPNGLMIARLNMPYGPSFSQPEPGSVPRTSGRIGLTGYNVLHSMVWRASHGLDLLVHRETERCMTWVKDTMRALAVIMESGQSGVWNVCRDDDHRSLADIASLVLRITGSESRIVMSDPPPGVTRRKPLDAGPLRQLGWKPAVNLEEGIRLSWEHYRRFDADGVWCG